MGERLEKIKNFLLDKHPEPPLFDPDFNKPEPKKLTPEEKLRQEIRRKIKKSASYEDIHNRTN